VLSGKGEDYIRHGLKAPLPKTKGSIRLATFNIENLFDDKDDPALSAEHDDKDMAKPASQSQAVAEAIIRLDADVLSLQEVESYEALIQFRDRYLTGSGYDHVVSIDSGDFRGIECSVLSRFPLKDAKVWKDLPLGGNHPDKWGDEPNREAGKPIVFRRSPLKVTVSVPAAKAAALAGEASPAGVAEAGKDFEFTVFVVHNKSGRPGSYWREAEARKTVELAAEAAKENPGIRMAVLGDFNAHGGEPSVMTFLNADPAAPGGNWTHLFGDRRPKDTESMTHSSDRSIDHILYNPAMAKHLLRDSRFVMGMPSRPKGADWRTTPPPPSYASDHYPVVVDVYPFTAAAAATPAGNPATNLAPKPPQGK